MHLSNRDKSAAGAEVMLSIRMPSISGIRDKMVCMHPDKAWLFIDGDGRAYVLRDGSESQKSRAHSNLGWLVGIYGGDDGLPSLGDLEGDVRHHLSAARG